MRMLSLPAIALSTVGFALLGFANIAQAQNAAKLFISGDMIRGNQAGAPGPSCVLNNQFKHLEKVVFRIKILDQNGNVVDDKGGLKDLVVELPDGQKLKARYAKHPGGPNPGTDFFWTAAWIIPADYPNGTFTYKVTATDPQDQTQTWEPFKVASSQLLVMAEAIEIKKP